MTREKLIILVLAIIVVGIGYEINEFNNRVKVLEAKINDLRFRDVHASSNDSISIKDLKDNIEVMFSATNIKIDELGEDLTKLNKKSSNDQELIIQKMSIDLMNIENKLNRISRQ